MDNFIFNLKGIVVVILVCEFMKNLLTTEKFAKYVNVAVSVFIIGFIISSVKGATFSLGEDYSFNYSGDIVSQNVLKEQYEEQIRNKIIAKLAENNIDAASVEVASDKDYKLQSLKIKIPMNKEIKEKTEKLLKGLGLTNYEVEFVN